MIEQHFLDDTRLQMRKLKDQADKAIAQVSDADLFAVLDAEANSIAIIMKHMAGNMRSRWTDFLTTDGEKPNRERDQEFIVEGSATRDQLIAMWEGGWTVFLDTMSALTVDDLGKTVQIRGQAHTVVEAINRQVIHYSSHVGQIVLLAKHYAGSNWRTLSVPRGKSKEFNASLAR
jgi:hypothetical protein